VAVEVALADSESETPLVPLLRTSALVTMPVEPIAPMFPPVEIRLMVGLASAVLPAVACVMLPAAVRLNDVPELNAMLDVLLKLSAPVALLLMNTLPTAVVALAGAEAKRLSVEAVVVTFTAPFVAPDPMLPPVAMIEMVGADRLPAPVEISRMLFCADRLIDATAVVTPAT